MKKGVSEKSIAKTEIFVSEMPIKTDKFQQVTDFIHKFS